MHNGPNKRQLTRPPHDVVEYRASHNHVSSKELERVARESVVQKDFAAAETHYKALIDVLSSEYDRLHLEVAIAFHSLAFVLDAQGKIDEADSVREKTSAILLSKQY